MAVNYTEEMTKELITEYQKNPCRDTVEALAKRFEKTTKSVIGKLSREGVYIREAYKTKTGEDPVTKVEIVTDICDALGVEVSYLEGLEKSPKGTLKKLKVIVAGED